MRKILINNFLFVFILIFIIPINICFAKKSSSDSPKSGDNPLITRLKKTIPDLMDQAIVPGLSIALIKDGKILWHKDFGIKNTKTKKPVSENTVYAAASLTKPFFSFAVMQMVEGGELDLDRPLYKYIPCRRIEKFLTHPLNIEGFRKEWLEKITARMVLSHTSGFTHGYVAVSTPYPLQFEPGTKYKYSGDGFGYLELIVEYLKGESLEEIMRKEVIEPLKMHNSDMVWQNRFENKAATGHDTFGETGGDVLKSFAANSSASLYTTAEDYAKFILAIINHVGIKGETVKKMLTPQINVARDVHWSMGFGVENTVKGDAFWHTGDFGVFRHYAIAWKKEKTGVVILTNSNNGLSICQEIVKNIIGITGNPGLAWQGYDDYDSPNKLLLQTIAKKGINEAIKLYLEMKEKIPEQVNEKKISSLAYTLMGSQKYEEAIKILKVSIKTTPKSLRLHSILADAHLRSGHYEQAIKKYKKVLFLNPKNKTAKKRLILIELTKILMNKGMDSAISYYTNLIKHYSTIYNENALSRFGNRLLRAGRVEEAIEIFKLNIKFNKKSSNAFLDLGDGYAKKGDKQLALKYIKKSLEISPGNGWAKMSLRQLENR